MQPFEFQQPRAATPGSRARRERGFTLIELLVVMIIISILMAIAVPTFLSQKSNARRSQALSNVHMIQQAIEACSASRSEGTYTGCTEHSPLYVFEPSLKHLPKCCSSKIEGEFDINGITAAGGRFGSPGPTDEVHGYEIFTWFNDGDTPVWFQLVHWDDGTVTKNCGAGMRPTWSKSKGVGVPGSRVCTTGTWG
ncbi:MAG: hypothetical protein JWM25_149 [Thermoleophilia bacterium]|nr:hypothetical protein [Thermoleophilia bacterium]